MESRPAVIRWRPARVLCLCLALCSAGATAQVPPTRQPTPEVPGRSPDSPPRGKTHDGGNWVPWAIIGAGAAYLGARLFQDRTYADDNSLMENGPRFPDSFPVGTFAVQGYFRDGWPMVLDFLAQPDSCTVLEISLNQKVVYTRLLDPDGRSGRQLLQLALPRGLSDRPRSALFVVRSERGTCAGQRAGVSYPSPIDIIGIGCGPRAVGSVAIDQLRFEPGAPRLPDELVQIGYRVKSGFNHASVEILRFRKEPSGQIHLERVRASRADGLVPGSVATDSWDGQDDGGRRSLGVHRLQVRAWFTENDRSWVGAISPTSVRVGD